MSIYKSEVESDEENEYVTKDDLLLELNLLIESIKTKNYSRSQLQDIHDSMEEYITGVKSELDPIIVEYLIKGWWLTDNMKKLNGIIPPTSPEICPFCIQIIGSQNIIECQK